MASVTTLVAVVVDGLAFGLFLALLGVGITLVFGLGEVLNLAIGTFAVIAVFVATELAPEYGLVVAAAIGIVAVGALGLLVDRTLLSLVYRSEGEERILLGIFVTLGLTIFLEGILFIRFPSRYSLPVELSSVGLGPARITTASLVVIAVAAVLLALVFAFLDRTFLGKATRTVFQDETGALLVGVDPRRVRTLVFVLSSLVAATAGVTFALGRTVSVPSGFEFTTFALIVSIVGGVRSVRGAVVAGVLLGEVITFANFFIGSFVASMVLFATAVVVILVKPGVLQ